MCHQTMYTLPCEHVKTVTVYCVNAPQASSSSSSSSKSAAGGGGNSSSSSSKASSKQRKPCKKVTRQSIPYPTPPSFAGDPAVAASSPLLPKCPLANCPFEEKNRCWNCCWCGKGWNERGRCSCIMIIEGNQVQCEHICCPNCQAAAASPSADPF